LTHPSPWCCRAAPAGRLADGRSPSAPCRAARRGLSSLGEGLVGCAGDVAAPCPFALLPGVRLHAVPLSDSPGLVCCPAAASLRLQGRRAGRVCPLPGIPTPAAPFRGWRCLCRIAALSGQQQGRSELGPVSRTRYGCSGLCGLRGHAGDKRVAAGVGSHRVHLPADCGPSLVQVECPLSAMRRHRRNTQPRGVTGSPTPSAPQWGTQAESRLAGPHSNRVISISIRDAE
jgi:hypothetical protein